MFQQIPCMLCREKHNTLMLDVISSILNTCKTANIKPSKEKLKIHNETYYRCRYGISCNELKNLNSRCNQMYNEMMPYLHAVANSDNDKIYHEIMQKLRGHFPKEYREMERWHAQYKKA